VDSASTHQCWVMLPVLTFNGAVSAMVLAARESSCDGAVEGQCKVASLLALAQQDLVWNLDVKGSTEDAFHPYYLTPKPRRRVSRCCVPLREPASTPSALTQRYAFVHAFRIPSFPTRMWRPARAHRSLSLSRYAAQCALQCCGRISITPNVSRPFPVWYRTPKSKDQIP
jgi:hypothetical protein